LTFQRCFLVESTSNTYVYHEAWNPPPLTFRLQYRLRQEDFDMAHDNDSIAQTAEQQSRVTIVFLALAWVFVLLRIWTRTYVIANFGWDDATMILASVRRNSGCVERTKS
jgi:hypothetical protein